MEMNEQVWNMMQNRMGYTDEEMNHFKSDPRNVDVVGKFAAHMNKTVVAEVVESHGCFSEHRVGDKFHLDIAGNVLSARCPERVCVHALASVSPAVFTMAELILAGIDPNDMRFKRVGCPDVGLRCGGWGRIVMEVRVQDEVG